MFNQLIEILGACQTLLEQPEVLQVFLVHWCQQLDASVESDARRLRCYYDIFKFLFENQFGHLGIRLVNTPSKLLQGLRKEEVFVSFCMRFADTETLRQLFNSAPTLTFGPTPEFHEEFRSLVLSNDAKTIHYLLSVPQFADTIAASLVILFEVTEKFPSRLERLLDALQLVSATEPARLKAVSVQIADSLQTNGRLQSARLLIGEHEPDHVAQQLRASPSALFQTLPLLEKLRDWDLPKDEWPRLCCQPRLTAAARAGVLQTPEQLRSLLENASESVSLRRF